MKIYLILIWKIYLMNVIYRFIETNIFWKYLPFLKMAAHADEDEEEGWEGNLVQPPENRCVGSPGRWKSIHLMMQDYHFWTYIQRMLLNTTEILPQRGSFLFSLNSQKLGTTYMSPNRRIKKMQWIYTMAYHSAVFYKVVSWNVYVNRQN